jgi:hypothetical protein
MQTNGTVQYVTVGYENWGLSKSLKEAAKVVKRLQSEGFRIEDVVVYYSTNNVCVFYRN